MDDAIVYVLCFFKENNKNKASVALLWRKVEYKCSKLLNITKYGRQINVGC